MGFDRREADQKNFNGGIACVRALADNVNDRLAAALVEEALGEIER
jgi:hypothetical protein